jgi:type II secretory pathway pseudopilin PulG
MRKLRQQAGFALTELLVAMSLATVVLGATLGPLDGLWQTTSRNSDQNVAQDEARLALDRIARELRNATALSDFIEVATASDLVFQTTDPAAPTGGTQNARNIMRTRYCFDPTARVLRRQSQTWTTSAAPASPSTATCANDGSWPEQTVIAEGLVVNSSRPVFLYNAPDAADISSVRVDLYVDVDRNARPGESHLSTGVFLRNKNRAPVAAFSYQTSGNRHVQLNASASLDPEGGTLSYRWFDGATAIGSGVTCDCVALATGNRDIKLHATDAGGLTNETTVTVNVL